MAFEPVTQDGGASGTCRPARYLRQLVGADGTWDTADDTTNGLSLFRYDVKGRMTASQSTLNAGDDNIWGTPDDPYFVETSCQERSLWLECIDKSQGSDGVLGTLDDRESLYWLSYDSAGRLIDKEGRFEGPDMKLNTPDDSTISVCRGTSDDRDRRVSWSCYVDFGPDQQWRTADDVPSSIQEFTFHGVHIVERVRSGGQDMRISTPPGAGDSDDTLHWLVRCTETRVIKTPVRDPGPDGQWFTSDDALDSVRTVYEGNDCGRVCGVPAELIR